MPPKKEKSVSEKYQMLSHLEHIKKLPDTYIGSISKLLSQRFIFNDESGKMEVRDVSIVPGLYKIFDEILVNAVDEATRSFGTDNPVNKISVSIDQESGEISISNNGGGIDVAIHEEHKIYIPEMIFGNLLTSANYDMDEDKTTGGKNGYGAKLTNIYSKKFSIEIMDSSRGILYTQTWADNMSVKSTPVIKKQKRASSWVNVSFIPDFKMFNMDHLTDDMNLVMKKRVYDVCACTPKNVSVHLNGKKLDVKSFEKYVDLYLGSNRTEHPRAHDETDRWEVVASPSPDGKFIQTSFVNGIHTLHGGRHVDYVSNMQEVSRAYQEEDKENCQTTIHQRSLITVHKINNCQSIL